MTSAEIEIRIDAEMEILSTSKNEVDRQEAINKINRLLALMAKSKK